MFADVGAGNLSLFDGVTFDVFGGCRFKGAAATFECELAVESIQNNANDDDVMTSPPPTTTTITAATTHTTTTTTTTTSRI